MTKKFFTGLVIVLVFANFAFCAEAENNTKKVVARVASQDITEAEVLEFIKPFGQQAMMLYGSEQGRKMIIDDVISMRLYANYAVENGLDKTPESRKCKTCNVGSGSYERSNQRFNGQ